MARTKQQNDMATRDKTSRKILQQVARQYDVEFNLFLEEVLEADGLLNWIEQQEVE